MKVHRLIDEIYFIVGGVVLAAIFVSLLFFMVFIALPSLTLSFVDSMGGNVVLSAALVLVSVFVAFSMWRFITEFIEPQEEVEESK